MKEYFALQLKMLNRQLTEWGIEPIIGYIVGVFAFIGLSLKLFEETQYGEYFYIALPLSLVMKLSEVNKNEFLKLCYPKIEFIKIRLIENLIFSIPIIIFLIYKEKYVALPSICCNILPKALKSTQ